MFPKIFLTSCAITLALCSTLYAGKDGSQDDRQDNPRAPLTKRRPLLSLEKQKEEAREIIFSDAFRQSFWGQHALLQKRYEERQVYNPRNEGRAWGDYELTYKPDYKKLQSSLAESPFSRNAQAILLFEGPPDLFFSLKRSRQKILESIPPSPGLTPRWAHLERLDLSKMGLVVFPWALTTCDNLICLDLSQNKLTEMPSGTYWPALKILSLADNNLGVLPKAAFHWTNLRRLDVSDNGLASLPDEVDQWTKLKSIDLSKNQIQSLCEGARAWGNTLRKLNLHRNNLKELPPFLETFPNLLEMDVSENRLNSLSAPVSLVKLNIAKNNLTVEAMGDLSRFTSLQSLHSKENAFMAIPQGLESLKQLAHLDMNCLGEGEDADFFEEFRCTLKFRVSPFLGALRQHRELQRTRAHNTTLEEQLKQVQARLHDLEKKVNSPE